MNIEQMKSAVRYRPSCKARHGLSNLTKLGAQIRYDILSGRVAGASYPEKDEKPAEGPIEKTIGNIAGIKEAAELVNGGALPKYIEDEYGVSIATIENHCNYRGIELLPLRERRAKQHKSILDLALKMVNEEGQSMRAVGRVIGHEARHVIDVIRKQGYRLNKETKKIEKA